MKKSIAILILSLLFINQKIEFSLAQASIQVSKLEVSNSTEEISVIEFIENWRLSWEGKQLDKYIDCYDENFNKDEMGIAEWKNYKQTLNTKYNDIQINIKDIQIDIQDDSANVMFYQVYNSDKYYDEGYKLLVLTHSEKSGWKILKEVSLN